MTNITKELEFYYLILVHLNSHLWLVAPTLDSVV